MHARFPCGHGKHVSWHVPSPTLQMFICTGACVITGTRYRDMKGRVTSLSVITLNLTHYLFCDMIRLSHLRVISPSSFSLLAHLSCGMSLCDIEGYHKEKQRYISILPTIQVRVLHFPNCLRAIFFFINIH